jgi:transcriptional regulator with XRE-family HTH domain
MEQIPFPQQLKKYRRNQKLTQAATAEQLNVATKTVQRWEQGRNTPHFAHQQNFVKHFQRNEASMKRRDLFHTALLASISFAPLQENRLSGLADILALETVPSPQNEQAAIEAIIDSCWLLLPHFSNTIGTKHLAFVQDFRRKMGETLKESSDPRFAEALCQVEQVEGRLLYAMKRLDQASYAYRHSIKIAKDFQKPLLEAIGLAWYSNFLIDVKRAPEALDPVNRDNELTRYGHATPIVRSWIFATEADAWANQKRSVESQRALYAAEEWMKMTGPAHEPYRIPYDKEWVYGYQGTVYAHIDAHQNAQSALHAGITDLGQAKVFRKWGFYKDLVISQSAEGKLEEACASAYNMCMIAKQTQAPMELWRSYDTIREHLLQRWSEHPLAKNLLEEFDLSKYS